MYKVVLAEFPFTESKLKKRRPILLLSDAYGKYKIVIAAYITSRRGEKLECDVEIQKSDVNGLTTDSVIRLHKMDNILSSAIKGELGELPSEKQREVRAKLKKLLGI